MNSQETGKSDLIFEPDLLFEWWTSDIRGGGNIYKVGFCKYSTSEYKIYNLQLKNRYVIFSLGP